MLPGHKSPWQSKSAPDRPGNPNLNLVRIGPAAAQIPQTLSPCGGLGWWWGGMQSHFYVKPTFSWIVVELKLSWGFENMSYSQMTYQNKQILYKKFFDFIHSNIFWNDCLGIKSHHNSCLTTYPLKVSFFSEFLSGNDIWQLNSYPVRIFQSQIHIWWKKVVNGWWPFYHNTLKFLIFVSIKVNMQNLSLLPCLEALQKFWWMVVVNVQAYSSVQLQV